MPEKKRTGYPGVLWAGTEHSLELAVEAHERLMAGVFDSAEPAAEVEVPYLFSMQGDVGVVSIRGSLVNRDSPYNRYFGVTSYADISRAIVYGATESGAKALLLDIDSGGGAVSGVDDASRLISSVNKDVMPVYAFTGGVMASAAYWLGVSADKVFISQTAITGSIGILSTHMEYSKALKEAGIGVTVMRAGEYKALANGFEPLTDTAKRQIQDQLNAAYGIFIGHVADRRGTTVVLADSTMGQGREFFGVQAVTAGLADGVKTFDGVMSFIESNTLDISGKRENNPHSYQRGADMTRKALTEQQIAAMAAGAPAAPAAVVPPVEPKAPEAAADEPKADEPKAEAKTDEPKTEAKTSDAVVTLLQGQLKEANAQVLALNLSLAQANDKAASMEASHAGLVAIAAQSVRHMKVALGLPATDLSGVKADALLAEHASTSAAFTKAFAAGGVAAVNTPDADEAAAPATDSLRQARIAATRFATK